MSTPWIVHVKAHQKQHGGSYRDAMKSAKSTYKPITKKTTKMRGDGFLDSVISGIGSIAGVDRSVNTLYPGERHGILNDITNPRTGKKVRAFAMYMGPNTNLSVRVRRGDPGLSNVDIASKAHDLRYSLSTNQEGVNRADDIMLKAVSTKPDTRWNKLQARLIWPKRQLARLGFNLGSTFGDPQLDKDPELKKLYETTLSQLAAQGYGKSKNTRTKVKGLCRKK